MSDVQIAAPASGLPRLPLGRLLGIHPRLRSAGLSAGAVARSLDCAPPGIYTLCYHHVVPGAAAGFRAQLAFLSRAGRFLTADAAAERLRAGRGQDERCFVLTLDDGYLDNVEVALPALVEQRVPAMLFLVSDWLDAPPRDGQAYVGRSHVAAWLAAGLDIGSHSASHRRLSALSREEVADEMARSTEALARLHGRPIRHFACPWGVVHADYRPDRDAALAREAGYETFFTTQRGRATDASVLMAMPRHVLEPEWPTSHLDTLMGGWRFGRR